MKLPCNFNGCLNLLKSYNCYEQIKYEKKLVCVTCDRFKERRLTLSCKTRTSMKNKRFCKTCKNKLNAYYNLDIECQIGKVLNKNVNIFNGNINTCNDHYFILNVDVGNIYKKLL